MDLATELKAIYFFQNEEIFVQLDELDWNTHVWNDIQLQPRANTENIPV